MRFLRGHKRSAVLSLSALFLLVSNYGCSAPQSNNTANRDVAWSEAATDSPERYASETHTETPSLVPKYTALPTEMPMESVAELSAAVPTKDISSDAFIANLFAEKKEAVRTIGCGTVTRLLADDTEGGRHQRFIIELGSGQTLLIAHNIDIAPRLDGLNIGDYVEFSGEYFYNEQGGGIHWTHHDPNSIHEGGWLKWNNEIWD